MTADAQTVPEQRVLIVEDESIVAEDIRYTLEHIGFAVSAMVSSGERAIEAVRLFGS